MKKPSFLLLSLSFLTVSAAACSFWNNLGQPQIPVSALTGTQPGSARILGHLHLADWAQNVHPLAYLTVFEARSEQDGAMEQRVFWSDGEHNGYVGVLTGQLGLDGVKTIFLDIGDNQRCIVGWVSPETPGTLLYFRLERPEPDTQRWFDGVKESTIDKNTFIVPIRADEQPERWNEIVLAAVQTKQSLKRGFDGTGSYFEIEMSFSPPLDVSAFYLPVSLATQEKP